MKYALLTMALVVTPATADKQYQYDDVSTFYITYDFCFPSNPTLGNVALIENVNTGAIANGCWRKGITNTYEILVEVGKNKPEEYIFDRDKFKEVAR
tara:strand:- start:79 stop:369 length:291 start_codon:yes stop_codon:yes gene_type:complete